MTAESAREWTFFSNHAHVLFCLFRDPEQTLREVAAIKQMSDTIYPYPTYAFGNRRAADQWYVKKQSRGLTRLFQVLFRLKGRLPDFSDPERIV